ncbi:hypothetical protein SAMN06269185_3187 [Natronoarchaeum philippinense]|uniref:DUF211 domain-containing protein n=1 Tax=Natronoarchaeum philippinense TaxID=558529 RepID=A0A285P8A8_NATPI|nr:DUF211 domain-containing protein [Natronoarchaeum philippinense]SNZ17979.1 hypothetical protein SAMN06269185_3187 [Natronoarchaeum philippinense]
MAPLRRLVVDVLKPHSPPLDEFAGHLGEVESVAAVTATLIELDKEVQNVEITFEGQDLDADTIEAAVEEFGGTVHSIDQVACGEYVAEDRRTVRDP